MCVSKDALSHTHATYAAHWQTTLAGVSLFYEHYGPHYLVVGNQFGRERALYKGHWACPTLIACETGRFINPIRDLPPLQKLWYAKRARGSFGHAVITTNACKVNTSRISVGGVSAQHTLFTRFCTMQIGKLCVTPPSPRFTFNIRIRGGM